jgi:hypothetical protein
MRLSIEQCVLVGLCTVAAALAASPCIHAQVADEWPGLQPGPSKMAPWLLKKVTPGEGSVSPEDPRFAKSLAVQFDPERLRADDNDRFRLPMLDGPDVVIVREREERRQDGLVWFGRIENDRDSVAILSLAGEVLSGSVRSPTRATHLIEWAGPGRYWLREADRHHHGREAKPERAPRGEVRYIVPGCGDPGDQVDVMVLYTPEARNEGASDELSADAMESLVYRFVAESNQSFLDSDVDVTLHLVHIEEFDLPESGDLATDLPAFRDSSVAQSLRDTYGADIAFLLEGHVSVLPTGLSYMPDPSASPSTADSAYGIAVRSSAEDELSFTHEIGHIFGADHDCDADDLTFTSGASHGFNEPSPNSGAHAWRTVMSTTSTVGSESLERLPRWSNPDQFYPESGGDPLGDDTGNCQANDHETLNLAAPIVANYRCSSPGRNDVWMKDTWSDTGDEPSSDIYIFDSPDIWVRTSRDADLVLQHEHQNPEYGSRNWIYVDLRNGASSDQSGDLELYLADSSTNIEWTAGWTLIKTVAVPTIPAHSTYIVETDWTTVPAPGRSYCMIARWSSATDPMTFPETANSCFNVLNNNNLVWKNLTVVDLVEGIPSTAFFYVRGVTGLPPDPDSLQRVTIAILPPPGKDSFIAAGRVRLRFDDALMRAWIEGGRKGSGFQADGDEFLLTDPRGASFAAMALAARESGQVTISFERTARTPRRDYMLHVVQRTSEGLVGGVSYAIRPIARPPEAPGNH